MKNIDLQPIRQAVIDSLNTHAKNTAIVYMLESGGQKTWTYAELLEDMKHLSEQIAKLNIKKNSRVAVILPHSPYAVISGLALIYSEMTAVMIDASLPEEKISELVEYADVALILSNREIADKLSARVRDKTAIITWDLRGDVSFYHKISCVVTGNTVPLDTDVLAILFSSGTTNQMKGVMITPESILTSLPMYRHLTGIYVGLKYLYVLPFNHIAGYTGAIQCLLLGAELGMIENMNSSKLMAAFQTYRPEFFAMVPQVYEVIHKKIEAEIEGKGVILNTVIRGLLGVSGFFRKKLGINLGKYFFRSINHAVFGRNMIGLGAGASICKAETSQFFLNLGYQWANFYSSTETGVPTVATGIHDRYPVGTVGNVRQFDDIQIRIENEDAEGIGEVYIRTPLGMKGYFREPELTEQAYDENGYFKTGDYGYIDRKGYLYITGRIKESIVLRTGKKVSPSDVDEYYVTHLESGVALASRGITDEEELYDETHLFVEEAEMSLEQKRQVREEIEAVSRIAPSTYKVSGVHFIPRIPKTSIGKVKRFLLQIPDENGYNRSAKIAVAEPKETTFVEIITNILRKLTGRTCSIEGEGQKMLLSEFGLDSLGMFEFSAEVAEQTGIDIAQIMKPEITVEELLRVLENRGKEVAHMENISEYPKQRTKRDKKHFKRFTAISKKLWKVKYIGLENVNANERYIFCPNHESLFDGMWMLGAFPDRKMCSMAADYLFDKKRYGLGTRIMGGIPVHRTSNTSPAMKRVLECITKEGYSLLIHPEGTRTRDGSLGEFLPGAASLAKHSGLKIVPVCISGAREIFPPHKRVPKIFGKRTKIEIQFGIPIEAGEKEVEELMVELRNAIVEMKGTKRGGC